MKCEELSNLQQQKRKEDEDLLVAKNWRWKCKECGIVASTKGFLRKHAEIHVRGLSSPQYTKISQSQTSDGDKRNKTGSLLFDKKNKNKNKKERMNRKTKSTKVINDKTIIT